MSRRRSRRPSAHPRESWAVFGFVAVLVVVASLVATVPSGDRTTITLALWGDLVVIALGAAVTYAIVSPTPDGPSYLSGSRGGFDGGGGFSGGGFSGGGFDGGGGGCGGGGGDGGC